MGEGEELREVEEAVEEFVREVKAISARAGRDYLRALGALVRRFGERLEKIGEA
jgi:hypothetical protein